MATDARRGCLSIGRLPHTKMEIWERFRDGMPPSRIDSELGHTHGTAHDVIVELWATDKLILSGRM